MFYYMEKATQKSSSKSGVERKKKMDIYINFTLEDFCRPICKSIERRKPPFSPQFLIFTMFKTDMSIFLLALVKNINLPCLSSYNLYFKPL